MARPDTWMPFYWGDFWRDTGHLSPAEGWAYINLIGAYWVQGKPLDADEGRLQRLAKVTSLSEWERVRRVVLAFFMRTVIDGNDCYSHSRIDRELAAATKAYGKRCAHIAKVNEKRRKKQSLSPVTDADTETVTDAVSQSLSTVTDIQPQPQSPNGEVQATPDADAPLKARIFGPCLEWLARQTKQNPNKLRALVGKWCSQHGDGNTLEAISAAQTSAALDPIPYITRVLAGGGRNARSAGTDWDGALAAAQGVEPMAADVRSAWDASRTIDGDFSPSARTGAGEPGAVPAGGERPENLDEGVRGAQRGPRGGADGVPENAGPSPAGPADARGGTDHHRLEMGGKTADAGGHPGDREGGIQRAADDAQPGPRGGDQGQSDPLEIPAFLDQRPGSEARRAQARTKLVA